MSKKPGLIVKSTSRKIFKSKAGPCFSGKVSSHRELRNYKNNEAGSSSETFTKHLKLDPGI
jgi:hypothetical protein